MLRRMAVMFLFSAPAFAQAPAEQPADTLTLNCPGQASLWENRAQGPTRMNHGGSVQVEIAAGRGRIHLPPEMVSPINSGKDGWFDFTSLKMEPNRITAVYRKSFLDRPSVTIDRLSGEIRIEDAANGFYGNCNPASGKQKF